MNRNRIIELSLKANSMREKILDMVSKAKSGHIASAFSIVEILVVLYYKILNVDPKNISMRDRDYFILSKGHGSAALYCVLAERGFFSINHLSTFCKPRSILGGHPEKQKIPGVEASTGSLGHGLSIAVGISLAGKFDKKTYRTFCLLGDGECNEGAIWEAAMSAAHYRLDNLIAIVDYNEIQASGRIDEVLSLHPLAEKWKAFGWGVHEIDGHRIEEILHTLKKTPFKKGYPSVVIAHTIKGKGVSFMEKVVSWHTMIPNEEELELARGELRIHKEILISGKKQK